MDLAAFNISLDLKTVDTAAAKVHVLDRGFLYGDSIYEVVRTYKGKLFGFAEHFARLQRSAAAIYLELPFSATQLKQHLQEQVARLATPNCYLRIIVSRGISELSIEPPARVQPLTVVIAKTLKEWPLRDYQQGVRLVTPQVARNPKSALDPQIKSGNYLNCVLAIYQARAMGGNDALILGTQQQLTESTLSNFFLVKKGVVLTPGLESGILDGITRALVEKICLQEKIPYHAGWLTMHDVATADESFITSTTREVMGVSAINDKKFVVPGPVTQKLAELYRQYVETHLDE